MSSSIRSLGGVRRTKSSVMGECWRPLNCGVFGSLKYGAIGEKVGNGLGLTDAAVEARQARDYNVSLNGAMDGVLQ